MAQVVREQGGEAELVAAPMVGGMITAPLLSMFVVPAVYLLLRRRELGMMGNHPGEASR